MSDRERIIELENKLNALENGFDEFVSMSHEMFNIIEYLRECIDGRSPIEEDG